MSEFFASDVGKVALGGLIAIVVQLLVFSLGWVKEHRVSSKKRDLDAQYLSIQVVLALDKLIADCLKAVYDPTYINPADGYTYSSVSNPAFALPDQGDYRTLPTQLMYELMFMPNRVAAIKEGLDSAWDESSPPDHDEYYSYRGEALSQLGLKAIELVESLCGRYRIPLPEWPKYYDPKRSFHTELARIEDNMKKHGLAIQPPPAESQPSP
ncbi:hypothetical protein [Pseudomonas amygdali]|uniref:DUF4760 domain-containing protein n=1 Tax=Pseudomonas amygdali pv. mori TaxID=34065 RepID=A0A3M5JDT3_PSEA0|nr:hypothetical protein [Pseudomonas amygdali]RMT20766.1 hypothetical protein ALP52_01981 [Pseudomonas amygdali pv. mori]